MNMKKPDLTLYLGGTRSGKSARAEAQALKTGSPVLYVATAETRLNDAAMHERIRRHRDRRPSHWRTLECPLHLAEGIAAALSSLPVGNSQPLPDRPVILLDCVTLWVSNILFSLPDPEDLPAFETAVRTETNNLITLMETSDCRWILVSGETGLGGIAADRTGRNYCDGLGLANQLLAARARRAFLVVAGRLLELKENL